MTTYTNAPAPRSALFDDAPAAPAVPTDPTYFREPPEHLTPAMRISQVKGGTWVAVPVVMQYGQPLPLALALSRVAIGRTVFVQPGDAETVLDAVRGGGNGETVP